MGKVYGLLARVACIVEAVERYATNPVAIKLNSL